MRVEWIGFRLVACAPLLAACSGTAAPYTSDADHGSTHALITVERREVVDARSAPQAKAFASFVRTPPEVDATAVTRIAGLDLRLPEVGSCALATASASRDSMVPLSPLSRIQLLDAGDVSLESASGRVELAPRAFPAVTDLVAGVVYTTRDRAATLPASEAYALSVAGSSSVAALAVSAEAPAVLESVLLGGVPLEDSARSLDARGTEVSWKPGAARDLVYAVIASDDGAPHATCTFLDEAGVGALPAFAVPSSALATLALHRLRTVTLAGTGVDAIDAGELRFDFELVASVGISGR
ncbi:MAG TPA: hypothetical protein VER33_19815 [Polyangiaceae bacterium]|nr:hypothetical protein [Polyangiaceae bacterium]